MVRSQLQTPREAPATVPEITVVSSPKPEIVAGLVSMLVLQFLQLGGMVYLVLKWGLLTH